MKWILGILALVALMTPAARAVTINGVNDGGDGHGSPVAVQDTPTGFGNNQSELNAAHLRWAGGGDLQLLLTGNLEPGGNGLVIFIDSRAGGAVASTVGAGYGVMGSVGGARIDDWGTDTDGGGGVNPTPGGGSILDPGFNPDIALEINADGGGTYYTNIIDLTIPNNGDPNIDEYLGSNSMTGASASQSYIRTDGDTSKGHGGSITHAFNNSNTAGVNGYPDGSGDPLSATTGYEALLSAEFLAADTRDICMMAFITNSDGGFLANQFLGSGGGVAGADNLGSPGGIGGTPLFDAQLFAGDQFFCAIPEPSTVALAGLALVGVACARRKRD
jgi:hypothetical protein